MDNKQKAFRQKVKNRKFAIDNSWQGTNQTNMPINNTEKSGRPASDDAGNQYVWAMLNENLAEADAYKFTDGQYPITSHRRFLGRIIVFLKRVVRKLLKVFLGWYIYPILGYRNHFNGKVVNVISLERELILSLENRINQLEMTNRQLQDELRDRLDEESVNLKTNMDHFRAEIETENVQREATFNRLNASLESERLNREKVENAVAALDEKLAHDSKVQQETISTLQTSLMKLENLPTSDDDFYHCFEERFRGSRDEIKARLQVYVPLIKERLQNWAEARFIDVGSGRGEWLDILKENGAADYVGVDLNERQNAICESYGHKTVCQDCIAYLAEQPDNSIDLISGIQIIEHLCMSDLMELLKQSYRVLKKGGMILFETQNPRNIIVGADTFYIDPSHKRPMEPRMIEFFAEWSGFESVRIVDANADPLWRGLPLPDESAEHYELVKQFNDIKWLMYGPMDYALFAVKE